MKIYKYIGTVAAVLFLKRKEELSFPFQNLRTERNIFTVFIFIHFISVSKKRKEKKCINIIQ